MTPRIRNTAKPRWRESLALRDGKTIMVALTTHSLVLRYKGRRTTVELPYCRAYWEAEKLAAQALILARMAARAERNRRSPKSKRSRK